MTTPFAPPSPYGQPRVAHADLTLHYGDGKRMLLRVDAPQVSMEYHQDRYGMDMLSFGSTMRSYIGPREVTLTLDGYLGEPERVEPAPAPAPARVEPAWSAADADPIADVRTWARRMREEAIPALSDALAGALGPVRDVNDVPTLDDLDAQ
jgi:hypothetical protein